MVSVGIEAGWSTRGGPLGTACAVVAGASGVGASVVIGTSVITSTATLAGEGPVELAASGRGASISRGPKSRLMAPSGFNTAGAPRPPFLAAALAFLSAAVCCRFAPDALPLATVWATALAADLRFAAALSSASSASIISSKSADSASLNGDSSWRPLSDDDDIIVHTPT